MGYAAVEVLIAYVVGGVAGCTDGRAGSRLADNGGMVWTWALAFAGKDTIAADVVVDRAAEAGDVKRDVDRHGTYVEHEAGAVEVPNTASHAGAWYCGGGLQAGRVHECDSWRLRKPQWASLGGRRSPEALTVFFAG